jgi:hypothetical protein
MSSWIHALFQTTKQTVQPQNDHPAADIDAADDGSTVECIARPFTLSEPGPDSEQCSNVVLVEVRNTSENTLHSLDYDAHLNKATVCEGSRPLEFVIGKHYATNDDLIKEVREFARSNGFSVAANTHPFSAQNPHPVLGPDVAKTHRGRVYCNYKDPAVKKEIKGVRTTCQWFVQFGFDRETIDHYIVKTCFEHNHDIIKPGVISNGGLKQITLDADLLDGERMMIHTLARYSLPLFKVYGIQSTCYP